VTPFVRPPDNSNPISEQAREASITLVLSEVENYYPGAEGVPMTAATSVKTHMRIACVVFAAALFFTSARAQVAAMPPVEAFAALPQVSPVSISPDGRTLAFVGARGGARSVVVVDLETGGERVILTDLQGGLDLEDCLWGSSKHLLCTEEGLHRTERRFARNWLLNWYPGASRLWRIDIEPDVDEKKRFSVIDVVGDFPNQIVGRAAEGEPRILVTLRDMGEGRASLREVTLAAGAWRLLVKERHPITFYFGGGADGSFIGLGLPRFTPRRIFEFSSTGEMVRERTDEWTSKEVNRLPLGFSTDGSRVYAVEQRAETVNVWSLDPAGKEPPRVLASHPGFDDPDWLFADPRRFYGAMVYSGQREVFYFDERYSRAAASIDKALPPGRLNVISASSRDARKMIVRSMSDTHPREYFLFDVTKTTLTPIAGEYPQLESVPMGSIERVRIRARDGAQIPGFLTTPPGAASAKNLPLIVIPAGVLASRGWGFGWREQFLAARGYAVLEINHRGSYGHDQRWADAAKGDVAGVPYRDVMDSVTWAVERGTADPKRVCLFGDSGFSGNLALLAGARSPDVFQAVATFGGIADMGEYVSRGNNYPFHLDLREFIGGGAKIRELSPIRMVKNAPPTLLVHGRRDRMVEWAQSKSMDNALERAGRDHELLVLKEANEDLNKPADRLTLLKALEQFFGQHCR
jgi:dipeptidyl aminopeptidase/acylaminoacyl peptidase